MVEKMTAVWLIILTIMVCSAVPAVLIWLTASPASNLIVGLDRAASMYSFAGAN